MERDFDTISPSARMLLLMKSITDIPYASDAARIVFSNDDPEKMDQLKTSKYFWGGAVHFENRFKSIDKILEDLKPKNILELSSGFSLRGLSMASSEDIFYIDTDLPNIIDTKKSLTDSLIASNAIKLKGTLLTLPLNAMDEQQFAEVTGKFPAGPITIVNEGLLMYLNPDEKRRLCTTIRNLLQARGGQWITADIYVRREEEEEDTTDQFRQQAKQFFAEHDIQQNKFESFEEAAGFFAENGFTVTRREGLVFERLSSLRFFGPAGNGRLKERMSDRQTWVLEPV